jgi:hypothetical protein
MRRYYEWTVWVEEEVYRKFVGIVGVGEGVG